MLLGRREFAGLAAAAIVSGAASQPSVHASARASELKALKDFAETTHPRGPEIRDLQAWQTGWQDAIAQAGSMSDGLYVSTCRRLLGIFDDGHTTVLPFEFVGGVPAQLAAGSFGLYLPFRARVFHDGAYVTAASADTPAIVGKQILSVGNMSAIDLVRAHVAAWSGSDVWGHRWGGYSFSRPAALEAIGAVSDPAAPLSLGLQSGGQRVEHQLLPARTAPLLVDLRRTTSVWEKWFQADGKANFVQAVPKHGAIYVAIDEMSDIEGRSFVDLGRAMVGQMAQPWAKRLIIDLRRNGGGNNKLGESLRKMVAASRFNKGGALYVLIAPQTFSAAQNLANRLERETHAIFVGEPTGGAPNHYGDAKSFVGQATGITAIVSTLPWFDSDPRDQRSWIMPDHLIPARFDDWLNGRDPALEFALADRPKTDDDPFAPARTFYYRRPSQHQDWSPFWRSRS
jgi:Peptidase family S41